MICNGPYGLYRRRILEIRKTEKTVAVFIEDDSVRVKGPVKGGREEGRMDEGRGSG